MIPIGLLRGTPVNFEDLREGDVIDTYHWEKAGLSRFHRLRDQTVKTVYSCDVYTDHDMICRHFGVQYQLIHRPQEPRP